MYLRGEDTPVFAVLHRGLAPRRETAILLCPPFGWEDMCCYRIRREWAEDLAAVGHTTLRIDLPGSGDSAGAPTDSLRLEAWTRAVEGAARWLRWAQEASHVTVIGLGLGGIVSCRAAFRGAQIDELILWSVPASGRSLLRAMRAFSRFEVANITGPGGTLPEPRPEDGGTLATNGYVLSAETVLHLEGLDLTEMEPRAPALRRALVLGRDGLKIDTAMPGVLERAGAAVTVADGPGYAAMMVEPQDARTPRDVFELVRSWLEAGESPRRAPAPSWRRGPATPTASGCPSADNEMVLHCSGKELRERTITFEGPTGRLFGVVTEPLGARSELTALLLNAGPQRRIGPNRMWVEIARRWAANGVPTLRLDASGIGDSDGDPKVLARVTEFYRPEYVDQARAALEMLTADGLPPRFVTLGLCAGAYWSSQLALLDKRVRAVIMLNPRTLVFDEWRHALRHTRQLRERALRASTWSKLLHGEIRFARHLETGRALAERAINRPWRAGGGSAAPRNGSASALASVEDLFDALRERDQRALLMFTGREVLHRELCEEGVLDRMARWPNLELAMLGTSADTHTLTPLWLQRQVHALVDRTLDNELERHSRQLHPQLT